MKSYRRSDINFILVILLLLINFESLHAGYIDPGEVSAYQASCSSNPDCTFHGIVNGMGAPCGGSEPSWMAHVTYYGSSGSFDCWPLTELYDGNPPAPGQNSSGGGPGAPESRGQCGSFIKPERQSVNERIEIVGVPFGLNYSSEKINSRKAERTLKVGITGNPIPLTLSSVDYVIEIAGRTISGTLPALISGQTFTYEWDGLDASSQPIFGQANVVVHLTESHTPAHTYEVPVTQRLMLINQEFFPHSVGAWFFDIHHIYDDQSDILYMGDGTTVKTYSNIISGNTAVANKDGSEIYLFDSNGKHLSTLNGIKGTTKYSFGYDGFGRLITITDANSNVTTVTRDGSGNPTAITSPYGQVTNINVDINGRITQIESPGSNQYNMTYYGDGLLHTFTNPNGTVSTMSYDGMQRLTSDISSAGSGYTYTYALTNDGVVADSTSAEGVVSKWQSSRNKFPPYIVSTTAVYGTDQSLSYFQSSRELYPEYLSKEEKLSEVGVYSEINYTEETRLLPMVRDVSSGSVSNGVTSGSFTKIRGTTLSNPSNIFSVTNITDTYSINGKTYTKVYSGSLSKHTFTTPLGITTSLVVDSQERPTQFKYASLHPIDFTYNSDGKLQKYEHTSSRPTFYSYNSLGQIITTENALGEETHYAYDLDGRVISVTLPDTRVIDYTYDGNGNITSITPPGKPSHDFDINAFNLMESYLPSTNPTIYTYDDDRKITQITRPNTDTINYTYSSSNGRLTGISTPTGNYSFTQSLYNYSYFDSITSPDGITQDYARNGNQVYNISTTGAINTSVAMTYNSNFQLATSTAMSAASIVYGYNNDARLTTAGHLVLTRSSSHGLVTKAKVGNATEDYTYSSFGEVASILGKYNTTQIYSAAFNRDDLGRVETLTQQYGSGPINTYEYLYDSAGRLTDVKLGGIIVNSYTYDSNSNRISATKSGVTQTATYSAYDQVITYGSKNYTYNANGELTQVTDTSTTPNGVYSYTYDTFGNLKSVTLPNGDIISYVLDGQDRRVGIYLNGNLQKQYIWSDQLRMVGELNSAGTLTTQYVYGDKVNVPEYIIKGSTRYKVMTNHIGSVVAVVHSTNGTVTQQIQYDEFGNVISDTNPGFQPFGFAGGIYDYRTKLVHFNAREYDPETGRWTSKDPILFAGGDTNLYGYVLSDPVNFIDPTGLYWFRQSWQQPGVVGRDKSIVEPAPRGQISHFIERYVPAGYTFGENHDRFVDWGRGLGWPDWLVNIPSMPNAYLYSVGQEALRSVGLISQPTPEGQVCK